MIIEFFGKRGSGKTTAIRNQILSAKKPAIVVDLLGNFSDLGYQTSSLSDALLKISDYLKTRDKQFEIITLKTASPDEAIDYASAALWEAYGGTLVLDECDAFSLSEAACFDDLIRYGRNRGVDVITGCRRPAEISKNITAAANKVFCFQTTEPRDIDYFEATVFGREARRLMNLPKYSGLYIDFDASTMGDFKTNAQGQIFLTSEKKL